MLPPKFEHFAADVSQSNESCTRELRAYPRCTRDLRPLPRSDTLSSAILIMFYWNLQTRIVYPLPTAAYQTTSIYLAEIANLVFIMGLLG